MQGPLQPLDRDRLSDRGRPGDFDSGQLGFNYAGFNAPAVDRDTWKTPKNLKPGTYTYFCRVHPFMRGSFRVVDR